MKLRFRAGPRITGGVLLGAGLLLASPADAQYFGRNQVQYESFDFQVLRTEHFDIHFYPREQAAAEAAARMAERWYARLAGILGHELSGRQPLILYATSPQFQQTNVVSGIGEGTGGVTEALLRRIVLPVGGTLGDLDHVLGHELVHAFQYDMTGSGSPAGLGGLPAASALPLWFIEGMAEYLSLGAAAPHTAMWMRGGIEDTLPSFRDLLDPRFFPYRYGHAFLAYIAGTWSDRILGDLLRAAGRSRDVGRAMQAVLGAPPDELVARWHAATYAAYQPVRSVTRPSDSAGTRIIEAAGIDGPGGYNLAPAVSPDGDRLMFLSDREQFSIDLFLADARSGEIRRQITETALDPHLQSLQFIQSAGSWAPDGRRFVFAGISKGRPVLRLHDAERGRAEREIRLGELGEIFNPSWSPDGRSIVFSGTVGGLADLFVYDLERERLRRLTSDRYADLQPVWSPDGRSIAFATDRFTTDLGTLRVGRYALALADAETGRITRVPGFDGARHLNPQWSPDGASLFFLADPLGITNVFRVRLADGAMSQVTDLFTGVSGITATSPALSVAQQTGRVVFSVFRPRGYEIYAIEPAAALAGTPVTRSMPGRPGVLPPAGRDQSQLARALADPVTGLPAEEEFEVQPYRGGLRLAYIGQPSLIAGSNQFGTYVGGGTSLYFSDLLGNHNVVTGLQVNGGAKDITALAGYQNLGGRLNWGVMAQQVPYLTGGYAAGTATVDGEPVFVEQRLLERQTNRDLQLMLAYPFSQAQRVEFSAGATHISFDRELRTRATSAIDGRLVIDDTEDLTAGDPLAMGVGSAALVFDNSLFGATGPIAGQRYRLGVSPTFGSLDFVGVLADYRRYFLPVRPFTLAGRILHFGRYGSGGEDPRLQPLYLGFSGLVRGYRYTSFDASECEPVAGDPGACPVFDQLLGSRMLVTNLELRFPLFGLLGIGPGYYGILPLDFTIFGDGGLAWDTANDPSFAGGDRKPVFSAGAGFRFNLFGFAVAEVNLVRPFDRPGKGWVWEFDLQPGF
ncbi:MAG TPA: BamA/TamA family outer membrane protein [Gemmatimonadales bacterium]|nr:BamA/TamA family outer membrane protein [Gemmatimonadales bacterium]